MGTARSAIITGILGCRKRGRMFGNAARQSTVGLTLSCMRLRGLVGRKGEE